MATTPNEMKKDTIYIDIDDEITAIIEKLQNSPQRIVALVLPKRASVLQSVVNMKLLKRSAETAKKHVVLITSEAGLLPLAGAVGLHVAGSLQSKPAIPPAPGSMTDSTTSSMPDTTMAAGAPENREEIADFDSDAAADKPIGALAGLPAVSPRETETIHMDNDDESPSEVGKATAAGSAAAGAGAAKAATVATKGKNKKLKIPDFNKFRILLVAGAALVLLLIGGFLYGNIALAKATVTLKTNSSDVAVKSNLTLDPAAKEFDIESETLPAKIATKQQTGSQQVSTSGEKNNGSKATGSITVSEVCSRKPAPIDSGTGFSTGGMTYISTNSTDLNPAGIDGDKNFVCKGEAKVIAQQAGAKYNIDAGAKFSVAGRSSASGQNGDAMSGGTDNIVKIVAQSDIDSAKQKITSQAKDGSALKDDLTQKLSDEGYTAITASLKAADAVVSPSAAVGDQADTVTVSQSTTYSMYGAKSADIKNVIAAQVRKQIDTTKQQVLKDGFDTAKYEISSAGTSGPLDVTLSTTALAGPDIKIDKLAAQLAGKKTGEVKSIAKSIPGVSDASVKYSPFWVSSVPNKASKVQIVIQKSAATARTSDGSSR